MIPEKDKYYKIKYINQGSPKTGYEGVARYTGDVEEDSEESDLTKGLLYVFDLEEDFIISPFAYFAEEDIIEEVTN